MNASDPTAETVSFSDARQLRDDASAQARFNMVEQQVRTWDVLDALVLAVLHALPREQFVRAEHRALAYADTALPVPGGSGELLFKPVIDGRVLQSLGLTGDEEVLEIGTGSGYTTACLAGLARRVTSIDVRSDFTSAAAVRLKSLGIHNVSLSCAHAFADFQPAHRFDVVVLGGAVAEIPDAIWRWLQPTGACFAIRGVSPVMEAVRLSGGAKAQVVKSLFETDLVYLRGAEPAARPFVL